MKEDNTMGEGVVDLGDESVDAVADLRNPENLGLEIGIAIHTGLRKSCGSPEASRAWDAINGLSDDEWWVVTDLAAKHVYALLGGDSDDKDALIEDLLVAIEDEAGGNLPAVIARARSLGYGGTAGGS